MNKSMETNHIQKPDFFKETQIMLNDNEKPMTNVFLTWYGNKTCGGVKLVLLDPPHPPMRGQWPKIKTQIDL